MLSHHAEEQLNVLLQKKNLNLNSFKPCGLKLSDSIEKHCAWAFEHIYSIPYPKESKETLAKHDGIARYHHGIQHTARAAFYIPIVANLFQRYTKLDLLTEEHIKLLQITALFHDAAREDENEDLWDAESGRLLQLYLLRVLEVDKDTAKRFAEVIVNKDMEDSYKYLSEDSLESETEKKQFENDPLQLILIKLLHDVDCLDIIRARDVFDGAYLHFCNDISCTNEVALNEMAKLITEVRSLIETQGDGRGRTKNIIKKRFEHKDAYQAIVNSLDSQKHAMLIALTQQDALTKKLIPDYKFDKSLGLTHENVQAAFHTGHILARAVVTPSAIRKKESKKIADERLIDVENRKMNRKLGVETSSGNLDRDGNENRSVTMIGHGTQVFGCAGYLKIGYNLEDIDEVFHVDSGTGRHKKVHYKNRVIKATNEEKQGHINELRAHQKLGGKAVSFSGINGAWSHNEIHYTIRSMDAIYYSKKDPHLYEQDAHGDPYPVSLYSPVLQAVYIQNAYFKFNGKRLPIFMFSSVHNSLQQVEWSVSHQKIKEIWVSMCTDFIEDEILKNFSPIYKMPLDEIKVVSMYGKKENAYAKCNMPADDNYDDVTYGKDFIKNINELILSEKEKVIKAEEQIILAKIQKDPSLILNNSVFWKILQSDLATHADVVTGINKMIPEIQYQIAILLAEENHNISATAKETKSIGNLLINKDDYYNIYSLIADEPLHRDLFKFYLISKKIKDANQIELVYTGAEEFIKRCVTHVRKNLGSNIRCCIWVIQIMIKYTGIFDLYDKYKDEISRLSLETVQSSISTLKNNDWSLYLAVIEILRLLGLLNAELKEEAKTSIQKFAPSCVTSELDQKNDQGFSLFRYLSIANVVGTSFDDKLKIISGYFTHNLVSKHKVADLKKIRAELREELKNPEQFQQILSVLAPHARIEDDYTLLLGDLYGLFTDWQFKLLTEMFLSKQLAEDKSSDYKKLICESALDLIKDNGLYFIILNSNERLMPLLTQVFASKDAKGPDYLAEALLKNNSIALNYLLFNYSTLLPDIIKYLSGSEKGRYSIAQMAAHKNPSGIMGLYRIILPYPHLFEDIFKAISSLKDGPERIARLFPLQDSDGWTILQYFAHSNKSMLTKLMTYAKDSDNWMKCLRETMLAKTNKGSTGLFYVARCTPDLMHYFFDLAKTSVEFKEDVLIALISKNNAGENALALLEKNDYIFKFVNNSSPAFIFKSMQILNYVCDDKEGNAVLIKALSQPLDLNWSSIEKEVLLQAITHLKKMPNWEDIKRKICAVFDEFIDKCSVVVLNQFFESKGFSVIAELINKTKDEINKSFLVATEAKSTIAAFLAAVGLFSNKANIAHLKYSEIMVTEDQSGNCHQMGPKLE